MTTSIPAIEVRKPVPQAFKNILVALNDDSIAPDAIGLAASLATPGVTRIRLLHLQQRSTHPNRRFNIPIDIETYKQAVDFSARMRAEARELGLDAQSEVGREVSGREAEQILLAAEDFGADLVIAGNRHKSRLDTLLQGNTTRDLVGKSKVRLLLLPATEK